GNDNVFIYYLLKNIDFNAFNAGSAVPTLNRNHIYPIPISLPPLSTQKAISEVLSSLDDKIDLLHRQNKTLEQMAETLFRQLYITHSNEINKDSVGYAWESNKLKEVTKIAIGRTPPRKEQEWFTKNVNDVKWISIKDLGNDGVFISNTSEYLTMQAVKNFNIPVIPKDTVVLSFKMTVGRVAITSEDMLSNEAIAHFKFQPNTPFTKEYLYLFLKTYRYDSLGSTSSIVTAINSAMIKDLEIFTPNSTTMDVFKKRTVPLFEKIHSNQNQIQTLVNLKNTLLPKLISGEIKINI
ncbi:MAG: restriction endonuclease subunit S, partial [Bacteroidales bacterium]|nr:restriction endonuclease subunit S [Bacteroidales bacterium]